MKGAYTGQILNAKAHGKGRWETTNGDSYEGEWADDQMHGQGTFTWSDGRKYVGEYKEGKKEGQGELYDAHGKATHKGVWTQDVFQR